MFYIPLSAQNVHDQFLVIATTQVRPQFAKRAGAGSATPA